jgi:hypothetical protein
VETSAIYIVRGRGLMSRRNHVEELEYGDVFGMDTTSPVSALAFKTGWVRDARNCDVGLYGGYFKRYGYTAQLSSAWGSRTITGGIEYKSSAGTQRKILYGIDGTDGRFGYIDAGAVTNILTGLSKLVRPGFVQFGDLLYFFNGVDTPKVYDGSATRQVGITAPTNAPSAAQNTSGSLTQLGSYLCAYTYYNSVTGAESSPSPITTVALTGANDQIDLTVDAGSATTADTIRFYRSGANGRQLFLDGTNAINDTTYSMTIADSALGDAMELDNSRIPDLASGAKYPAVAQNRIFLVTGNNEIRHSKIGQSGAMGESFEVKAAVDTQGRNGGNDRLVGIGSANDIPFALKEKSIGRLDAVGIPDNQLSTDNVIYIYRELSDKIGAVSHWAAVEVEGELVWLSYDNVYATDGQRIRPVADAIQATIRGLGFGSGQVANLSAINDRKHKRLYFQVYLTSAASTPDYVLVGNYARRGEGGALSFRWTWYTPGTNTTTHPGIRAASYFAVTGTDGAQEVWFGNTVLNGQVYRMNDGHSDATLGIYMKIVTRPYAFRKPLFVKLYGPTGIHVKGDGDDYNLTTSAIYDLGEAETGQVEINLASGGYVYDNSYYDQAYYLQELILSRKYPSHRKAKFQQLVFKQTDADSYLEIYGWGPSGSIFRAF